MTGKQRILGILSGQDVDSLPIWLMRQAGRFLPEYRAVRAEHSFLELVHNPALCTEVALQPLRRFDLDGTIVFSDILVIPDALGAELRFVQGDGPSFGRPVRAPGDVAALNSVGVRDRLGYVYSAVESLRKAAPDHALFGFAGSPWTLFCYLVQGAGSSDFAIAKSFLRQHPLEASALLALLADCVSDHLRAQHEAGADVVQVFDTWGGLLSASEYQRWCAPGLAAIARSLGSTPSVLFVRAGAHLVELTRSLGFSALSLHDTVDLDQVHNVPTQGNLDPTTLLAGSAAIEAEVARLHRQLGGRRNHIWNLGHGILPPTPPEAVGTFVAAVRRLG